MPTLQTTLESEFYPCRWVSNAKEALKGEAMVLKSPSLRLPLGTHLLDSMIQKASQVSPNSQPHLGPKALLTVFPELHREQRAEEELSQALLVFLTFCPYLTSL